MKPAPLNWPPKPINANYWDPVLLSTRRATLGKDLAESSNISPKQRSLLSHNCAWTLKQFEFYRMWQNSHVRKVYIQPVAHSRLRLKLKTRYNVQNNENKRGAACQRSKLVFKTLQPLLGWGVAAPEGFHDPRLSSWDGMGYTLHCVT